MDITNKYLPYSVTIPLRLNRSTRNWCNEFIGERWDAVGNRTGLWTCFWAGRDNPWCYTWHFKNEKDANWFKLKWL